MGGGGGGGGGREEGGGGGYINFSSGEKGANHQNVSLVLIKCASVTVMSHDTADWQKN